MALRVMVLAVTVVLLGSGLVEAAAIMSGSVRVDYGDSLACIAPNGGTGTIGTMTVVIQFNQINGGSNGYGGGICDGLAPGRACTISSSGALNDFSAHCKITFSSGRVRGTFCNNTKALCADAR
jgi:hypothetical protein